MPARKQLPFVAIEDKRCNICWAAIFEAPCSWMIETVFRNGNISVGGGQSDFLTGHWRKKLGKGESFITRKAYLTVVNGNLEKACSRLVQYYYVNQNLNDFEKSLPINLQRMVFFMGEAAL